MSESWKRDAFENLEPPPGGLTRLRARLDADTGPSFEWAYALTSMLAGAVALAVILRPTPPPPPRADLIDADHPALISYGLAEPPAEPVTIAPGARTQIAAYRADPSDDVVFYWVSRPAVASTDQRNAH